MTKGHDGMLYALVSGDLIADSVRYLVNAHCANALVCISNGENRTPGLPNGPKKSSYGVKGLSRTGYSG